MKSLRVLLLAAALVAAGLPAAADPGPDEILDSMFGADTLGECVVMATGSCTATWNMTGAVSFYIHMDFHNAAAIGSYVAQWRDANGVVDSWTCPFTGPGCVQSDYGDSFTSLYIHASAPSYRGGQQWLDVTVTDAICAPPPCSFHGAYRRTA